MAGEDEAKGLEAESEGEKEPTTESEEPKEVQPVAAQANLEKQAEKISTQLDNGEEELQAPRAPVLHIFDLGIVVHELAHYIGALLTESKVYHVTLLDKRGGRIWHRHVSGFKIFIIALMPFFIGNALAFLLFTDSIRAFHAGNLSYLILALWLGISISLYARPSPQDLRQAWKYSDQMWRGSTLHKLAYLVFLPVVYFLLILMEIRQRVFGSLEGSFAWVLLSILTANFYVGIFG